MAQTTESQALNLILHLPGGIGVRPYRDSDAPSLSRNANNKNVLKFLRDRIPNPYTKESAKFWIDFVSKEENMTRSGNWTLEGGSEGPLVPTNYAVTVNEEAVGTIGLNFGNDVYFRTAEIGYWLGEEHWGKGVMSKVVPPFMQWAWDTFNILVRVNSETSGENVGSQSVLKKAGFVFEGRRVNAICKNGKLQDALMFGALRPT